MTAAQPVEPACQLEVSDFERTLMIAWLMVINSAPLRDRPYLVIVAMGAAFKAHPIIYCVPCGSPPMAITAAASHSRSDPEGSHIFDLVPGTLITPEAGP